MHSCILPVRFLGLRDSMDDDDDDDDDCLMNFEDV